MKRIALVTFFIFFCNALYAADNVVLQTGTDWLGMSQLEKAGYINGFISATTHMSSGLATSASETYNEAESMKLVSYLYDEKYSKRKYTPKEVIRIIDQETIWKNRNLNTYTLFNITIGQFMKGLDEFYSDYKNQQIYITDAIYAVSMQIKGGSDEDHEAILLFLRSGKKGDKRVYKDKDGTHKYIGYPYY